MRVYVCVRRTELVVANNGAGIPSGLFMCTTR